MPSGKTSLRYMSAARRVSNIYVPKPSCVSGSSAQTFHTNPGVLDRNGANPSIRAENSSRSPAARKVTCTITGASSASPAGVRASYPAAIPFIIKDAAPDATRSENDCCTVRSGETADKPEALRRIRKVTSPIYPGQLCTGSPASQLKVS